jgi:hypothetical protein
MRKVFWALAGLIVVVLGGFAGTLAFDAPVKPEPLASISEPFANVDFSDLPIEQTYVAKRFNETLVLLEHYNEGLACRLRQAAQKLLAPSCREQGENTLPQTEAPSIVLIGQTPNSSREADPTPASTDVEPPLTSIELKETPAFKEDK